MFDIGWTEILVIGIVALIVVGPKDLPGMFRTLGKFTAKLRAMARDFQRSMEQAADEAGVKDVAADLRGMTSPRKMGLDALKDAAKFDDDDAAPKTPKKANPAAEHAEHTAKLAAEREEAARKIREYSAEKIRARREAEAAAAATDAATVADAGDDPGATAQPGSAPARDGDAT